MHFKWTPAGGISFQVSNWAIACVVFTVVYVTGGLKHFQEFLRDQAGPALAYANEVKNQAPLPIFVKALINLFR